MSAAIAKRMNSAPPAISVYTGAWWVSGMGCGGGVGVVEGIEGVGRTRVSRTPPLLLQGCGTGETRCRRGTGAVHRQAHHPLGDAAGQQLASDHGDARADAVADDRAKGDAEGLLGSRLHRGSRYGVHGALSRGALRPMAPRGS